MAYTVRNFKTKKELKEAVNDYFNKGPIKCYNPGLGPDLSNWTGSVYLEGPHAPLPHKWYAEGVMKDGVLVKVK